MVKSYTYDKKLVKSYSYGKKLYLCNNFDDNFVSAFTVM